MGHRHLTPVPSGGDRQSLFHHLDELTTPMRSLADVLREAQDHGAALLLATLCDDLEAKLSGMAAQLGAALGGEVEVEVVPGLGRIVRVLVGGREVAA